MKKMRQNHSEKRTYISLFSSAGVGCFGFKKAGFDCIATSELIDSRLDIQRYNKKCKYDSGYISGDFTLKDVQDKLREEIKLWRDKENVDDIDVIVATPPCQGMSTANYKKNNEQKRNSLVVEAIKTVVDVKPKVFVFENVRAFMKTICTDVDGVDRLIKDAIYNNLGKDYNIDYKIINFKEYGVPSSRPRTLVIGTRKDQKYMSPLNLFPYPEKQIPLRQSIGDLMSLTDYDQYDPEDCYHAFRKYDSYMREWIHDLKEGESAFSNPDEKKPYKIVNGKRQTLKSGFLGNKFRRLYWDKPCACVATRNDQLASMDTIHPSDDRVLSIRELMRVMTIPDDFNWLPSDKPDYETIKRNELNIRRCIGEAVPTLIMSKIARNINDMFDLNEYIEYGDTGKSNYYIESYRSELCSEDAKENGVFYTPQAVVFDSLKRIDNYSKDYVRILEPSVGGGNFLLPIISKFYKTAKITIDIVDIDSDTLAKTMNELSKYNLDPDRVEIIPHASDFMEYDITDRYDFIIGNPPYFKMSSELKRKYSETLDVPCDNIYGMFLERIHDKADNIIMVIPKTFLMVPEFNTTRKKYENYDIISIDDYGVKAFKTVFIEIMSIYFTKKTSDKITITNHLDDSTRVVDQGYIYHDKSWLIYRDEFFDSYIKSLTLDVFDFFRDRQITNSHLSDKGKFWVLKSKNILDNGEIIHIPGYDKYVDDCSKFVVSKYLNSDSIIMPNFTYNTRATKLPKNVIPNGSIAILLPKDESIDPDEIDLSIYSTDDFRRYYAIVKNNSKFTINIDKNSIYYIGVRRKERA